VSPSALAVLGLISLAERAFDNLSVRKFGRSHPLRNLTMWDRYTTTNWEDVWLWYRIRTPTGS
jgi:hypothetical protein